MIILKDRQLGIIGLVVFLFLLGTLWDRSFQARALPTVVLAILIVLSITMICRKQQERYDFTYLRHVLLYGGLIIIYVILLPLIGFVISTSGFLAAFLFLQKYPMKPWKIILFAICTSFVFYALFAWGFQVRLPEILF